MRIEDKIIEAHKIMSNNSIECQEIGLQLFDIMDGVIVIDW